MFTGIVEAVGSLKSLKKRGNGYEILVETPDEFRLKERVKLGDSIANNGVCLTVTSISGNCFGADVSTETVRCTCFGYYKSGHRINLELACTPETHLGGHIVQGHVDGIGLVTSRKVLDDAFDIMVRVPSDLLRYIATKGSIAVDGVSLTVNEVRGDEFRLTLIPHTQSQVNFENFKEGCRVNIEVDVLSRYLERLLSFGSFERKEQKSSALTLEKLHKNGFF
ncbi:MAG: riboflavin synthase [Succinivibrio sp.]